MIFVFLCLTSLCIIFSRFIHVAANGITSFFFMTIFHYIYTSSTSSLSIKLYTLNISSLLYEVGITFLKKAVH